MFENIGNLTDEELLEKFKSVHRGFPKDYSGNEELENMTDSELLEKFRSIYQDGWSENKWQEEMEKHPFFRSKPLNRQEIPPIIEALQQLKYDPEFNTPCELAMAYKKDGNENFKNEKYQWAIDSYTQALNVKCEDDTLNAALYSNRAAAEYHLGNYRQSLKNAVKAKALNPCNFKAVRRGALCYYQLKEYENCILWCDEGLKLEAGNKDLEDLKKLCYEEKEKVKESERVAFKNKRKEQLRLYKLGKALDERGIKRENLPPKHLPTDVPEAYQSKAHLTSEGVLIWPVLLLYPEYNTTDFIQAFDEQTCMYDHLVTMFAELPEWDVKKEYIPENLQVYFTSSDDELVSIDKMQPLKTVLQDKRFRLTGWTLTFIVTVANSEFDKMYISRSQTS